jgi:signal transduction histidine kinase
MKTLLALTRQKEFAEAIRALADERCFRVLHCGEPLEAEGILARGGIDACLVEIEVVEPRSIQLIADLRRSFPEGPLFIFAGARQAEVEEMAYLRGATHVLSKPVRGALLNHLLDRALQVPRGGKAATPHPSPPLLANPTPALQTTAETLSVLRKFSSILAHSLQAETLVRHFLLMLREVLGVNRAAVYLRPRPGAPADPGAGQTARGLRVSCVVGLRSDLLRQFDLSLDAGIGACLERGGRILRRDSAMAREDEEIRREFEIVGAQVAVPILDRENLLGVALFDHRLTDEVFTTAELGLIFHLFEELGVALRVIWQQEEARAGHMMGKECSDADPLRASEIETASLRLVRILAERLSQEVGNALVPLSTHQQLIDRRKGDPEFIQSLQTALENGVRRVSRLASQMHFLARDLPSRVETIPLEQLIQGAFREVQRQHPEPKATLSFDQGRGALFLQGDRLSLRHAFQELILNALQASPGEPRVSIRAVLRRDEQGGAWVETEVADTGPGFPPEAVNHVVNPFFTTRKVGLGLGLTVARRIIETHQGKLEIAPPDRPVAGLVRVSLPLGVPGDRRATA